MGPHYETEFVWERDDDGTHTQELRKVSWRKWEPRYVKKEDDGWDVVSAGGSDAAKNQALLKQMLGE